MLIMSSVLLSCTKSVHLYVATNGNDNSDGSIENPFYTIRKAVDVAREFRGSHKRCNITIVVRKGTYYLDKPLLFSPEDSGTEGFPLTISGYQGEKPVLSGGRRINLTWKTYRNGIFMSEIEKDMSFDQLYINGEKQILARYPDFDPSVPFWNGYAADADSPKRLLSYKHPEGAYIHKMHPGLWGGFHFMIKSVKPDGQPKLEGGYQNNRSSTVFHPEYKFIENVFEELNAPHEWYYDADNGILYYKPAEVLDLKSAVVEVPLLESCLAFKGTMQKPVHDIVIRGLIFRHTLRTFMKTREPLLRSDWTIYRQGMVFIEGAERISIENCEFDSPGGNAIFISNYNRSVNISGNYIHDVGAGGINFVGNPSAVRSPLFEYSQSNSPQTIDTVPGPANKDYPSGCKAYDNLICSTGRIEKQTAGVNLSMSSEITVSHNSIYNVPRAGINICDGTWGGHIIEFNDVFNTVLETGDHGAFNSWGRDRYWFPVRERMDSITSANPKLAKADAVKTTIIRNNRMRCDRGWDIDLDDGSSNYLLENNLCLTGGIKLREGLFRRIENNIMVNNSIHLHAWFAKSEDIIRHNIVCNAFKPVYMNGWGKEIDYNLFATNYALARARQNGTDRNSVAGDPLFKDPASSDFRVTENSPAIKIGFKNFDMHSFGVVSPKLRQLTLKPEIPKLNILNVEEESDKSISWRGSEIKKLKGISEMSATGMTSESGILITKLDSDSPLKKSGLKVNDVIIKVNGNTVSSLQQFFYYYEEQSWVHTVDLTVYRNQVETKIIFPK
ncbi:MAG: PDZ domain-containing protein [Bacteroidia bacterium]|nr:PDZ domain-containing protein [Bacteroidia bacterium]